MFPLLRDNNTIGVIHADGNGFGQLLINLQAALKRAEERASGLDYAGHFSAISEAMAAMTLTAARKATADILVPNAPTGVMPARPILLGGDDLSIIVRGDLAVDFTERFLETFREASRQHLERLRKRADLPAMAEVLAGREHLTAGAGIAFVKASQPFYLANGLAEDLAKAAKRAAKRGAQRDATPGEATPPVPSCLAFHRITTAMIDTFADIDERELRSRWDGAPYRLSAQPYALEPGPHGLALLTSLQALKMWLDGEQSARGRLRTILTCAADEPERGAQLYRRWYGVTKSDDPTALDDLETLLQALDVEGFGAKGPGFRSGDTAEDRATPLFDALALRMVERGKVAPIESADAA